MYFRLFTLLKSGAVSAVPWLYIAALLFFVTVSPVRAEPPNQLDFITTSGRHTFLVEVADTPAERAKGLMYRRSMPRNQGMLFQFEEAAPVGFWMKNTYIPLDMVFVSSKGKVTKIAANTVPFSEETISSGGPVLAVVELNAGLASEMGLKPGDEVWYPPLFKH